MQIITQIIEAKFRQAFNVIGIKEDQPILLVEATRLEFGDYQVNGVMGAAKALKINPRQLAQQVIDHLDLSEIASKLEIAGPGFINITLNDNYLAQHIRMLNQNNKFGAILSEDEKQRITIDMSSPNLAKEMHVGHLRSTVIGDALANIFEYMGNTVIRQNHVGDWGTQFGMLIAYMEENAGDNTVKHSISDLEEFYRNAKIRFDESKEFADTARHYVVILQNWQNFGAEGKKVYAYWQVFKNASLKHCDEVYNKLCINLTKNDLAPESMYNDKLDEVINRLEAKQLITVSNGAKCVFFEANELEGGETTPYILQKQDGGYLYSTTDLAAIDYRVNTLKSDRLLYVVDARQSFHFKQLFLLSKKADFANKSTILEHVAFGTMMNEDGKPFKTRSGGTVKLIDLINEAVLRAKKVVQERNSDWDINKQNELANILAIGAIKYADLSKNRTSDYIFSFDKMLAFDGNTAPYLMYAYTRIKSLLVKANYSQNKNEHKQFSAIQIVDHNEHKLAIHLAKFAHVIYLTAKECYPHYLCQYLYQLAVIFMQFYEQCSILKAESDAIKISRLELSDLTAQIMQTGLRSLGIQTVERM